MHSPKVENLLLFVVVVALGSGVLGARREGVVDRGTTTGPGFKRIGSVRKLDSWIFLPHPKNLICVGNLLSGATTCPETHKFALNEGHNCCSGSHRINDTNLHPDCDGSFMSVHVNLTCCPFGDYVDCKGAKCSDRSIGNIRGTIFIKSKVVGDSVIW